MPSVLPIVVTLPSSDEGGCNQLSSDESDGESEVESTGGDDELREGANLPSFSSLSPPPLCAEPYTRSLPSPNQTSVSSETCSRPTVSHCMNTARGTVGTTELDLEEKEVVGVRDSQDVNLLTLTFGRYNVEEDVAVVERMTPSSFEQISITSVQTSHPRDTREIGTEIMFCSSDEDDEKEDEEGSGYMGRPCAAAIQGLID